MIIENILIDYWGTYVIECIYINNDDILTHNIDSSMKKKNFSTLDFWHSGILYMKEF